MIPAAIIDAEEDISVSALQRAFGTNQKVSFRDRGVASGTVASYGFIHMG